MKNKNKEGREEGIVLLQYIKCQVGHCNGCVKYELNDTTIV